MLWLCSHRLFYCNRNVRLFYSSVTVLRHSMSFEGVHVCHGVCLLARMCDDYFVSLKFIQIQWKYAVQYVHFRFERAIISVQRCLFYFCLPSPLFVFRSLSLFLFLSVSTAFIYWYIYAIVFPLDLFQHGRPYVLHSHQYEQLSMLQSYVHMWQMCHAGVRLL